MRNIQAGNDCWRARRLLGWLAMFVASTSFAGGVYVKLPSQPLSSALRAMSPQTGLQIVTQAALTEGKTAPALDGSYEPVEALTALLKGSGLTAYAINTNTYGIREAAVAVPASGRILLAANTPNATNNGTVSETSARAASPDDSVGLAEVVVTGSRVITNGNDSPTPVTVISTAELQAASPGSIYEALQTIPALLGPPNQGGQGGGVQAVLNLRGLGGARNLVLFDGHRLGPGSSDTNLLPSVLLKRVDIVTGGASAVYGSDAVSGVVNYIIDNNFTGFKFAGSTGQTTYNDDGRYSASMAFGTSLFGGRGHFEIGYQRSYDPGFQSRFSRQWGQQLWSVQGSVVGSTAAAGTAANPWALYSNTRLSVTTFGGLINTGPLAGLQFKQNGVLTPFVHGVPTGSTQAEIGGDGGYYTTYSAYGTENADQGLARFDFNFTDNLKGYAELTAGTVLNKAYNANTEVRTRAIGYNNAYLGALLPTTYRTTIASQLAANPLSSFNFSRIFTADQVAPAVSGSRGTQFMFLSGLEGSWGKYKWDVGFEHSDSTSTTRNPNNIYAARLYAAMNAVINPANGQVVCNAALVNPAVYGDCVPLNVFGPTSVNADALNYIKGTSTSYTRYLMDDVTAGVSGSPVSNWAGPIDMALSAEWRRLSYEVGSNVPITPISCAGVQFNCSTTGVFLTGNTSAFPKASQTVGEAAYEAQVPLLKNLPLAKSLDLNTAIRYTNYSFSGVVWTWKAGLTWGVNDTLKLRLARSRDIRAPSIQNLYAPLSSGTQNITDIHTNSPGNVISINQGNPNLVPEKADTLTAGYIWTPRFLEGLDVSMDYYHIRIGQALNGVTPALPPAQTACEISNGTSPVCDLYIRPFPFSNRTPANFPTAIINQTLNTGGFLTYGVDTEISYARELAGRPFRTRLLLNYQPHLIYDQGPAGILDIGGAGDGAPGLYYTPSLKGVAQFTYDVVNDLTATVQARYRNAVKQNGSPLIFFAIGKLPAVWYTDLNLNYRVNVSRGKFETYLNIRNLWNQQPPTYAVVGGSSQIGSLGGYMPGDDTLGRYYTLGFRYQL